MKRAAPALWECASQTVEGLGYEFVGARYGQEDGNQVLRVFIDSPDGISVDDCGNVSQQLSAVLDVENIVQAEYVLEVSSPGIERPLFEERDFERVKGERVALKLLFAQDGRRRFKGQLLDCCHGEIKLAVDQTEYLIPLASIEQAHLSPDESAYRPRR